MTRPIDRAAAQRAVAAWKLKRSAEPTAEGFGFDAAVELSGLDADTFGLWVECGLIDTSLTQDGDDEYRFSSIDALAAMILSDLIDAGVSPLVAALAAVHGGGLTADYADQPEPDVLLARMADSTGDAHVYPLTLELAERWFFDGLGTVTRSMWSPERLAEVRSWSPERAAELAAEAIDTAGCVERGEAVEYRSSATAARLQRRLDAWWVANAGRPAARRK